MNDPTNQPNRIPDVVRALSTPSPDVTPVPDDVFDAMADEVVDEPPADALLRAFRRAEQSHTSIEL